MEPRGAQRRSPISSARTNRLAELNVEAQVANVCHTTIVQDAWKRGQALTVHGWIYALKDGLLARPRHRRRVVGPDPDRVSVLAAADRAARSRRPSACTRRRSSCWSHGSDDRVGVGRRLLVPGLAVKPTAGFGLTTSSFADRPSTSPRARSRRAPCAPRSARAARAGRSTPSTASADRACPLPCCRDDRADDLCRAAERRSASHVAAARAGSETNAN